MSMQDESSFTAQAGTAGSNGYGSFALAANGSWTYTANNSQAAIQQLGAGRNRSATALPRSRPTGPPTRW